MKQAPNPKHETFPKRIKSLFSRSKNPYSLLFCKAGRRREEGYTQQAISIGFLVAAYYELRGRGAEEKSLVNDTCAKGFVSE